MKTIFLTEFGSAIYGTKTPTSDTDIKGIYLPTAKEILLQNVKDSVNMSTKIDKKEKNSSSDVDTEYFSLQRYLNLLLDGQTVALDMIFTPPKFWISKEMTYNSVWWNTVLAYRHEFLHKGLSSFIGYCRTQSAKYGIKGTRVASLRLTLDWLAQFSPDQKLLELPVLHFVQSSNNEFIKITEIRNPRGIMEPHLQVNDRKIAYHCTIKYTMEVFQKIFDKYGHRALLAEKNEGVDWKALSHAVRVCTQAKELLRDHIITFPRPDASLLLQIKNGELQYNQVAEIIENGMIDVELATKNSTLPEKPNYNLASKIIEEAYKDMVIHAF